MPAIRYPRYMENAWCPILKSVAMQTPISTATHTHSCTHLRKAPHMMHMHMETAYNHSPIAKHRGKTTSLNLVRSPSPLLSFPSLSISLPLFFFFFSLDLSVAEAKERRNEDVIGMRSLPLSLSGYSDSLPFFLLYIFFLSKQFA